MKRTWIIAMVLACGVVAVGVTGVLVHRSRKSAEEAQRHTWHITVALPNGAATDFDWDMRTPSEALCDRLSASLRPLLADVPAEGDRPVSLGTIRCDYRHTGRVEGLEEEVGRRLREKHGAGARLEVRSTCTTTMQFHGELWVVPGQAVYLADMLDEEHPFAPDDSLSWHFMAPYDDAPDPALLAALIAHQVRQRHELVVSGRDTKTE